MALPPGRARLSTQPPPTGIDRRDEHNRDRAARLLQAPTIEPAVARMTSGLRATSSAAYLRQARHRPRPSGSRCARCGQPSNPIPAGPGDGRDTAVSLRIVCGHRHEHADAPHPLGCCARPASGHAAAPPSSVMNSRRLGTWRHPLRRSTVPQSRTGGGLCVHSPLEPMTG